VRGKLGRWWDAVPVTETLELSPWSRCLGRLLVTENKREPAGPESASGPQSPEQIPLAPVYCSEARETFGWRCTQPWGGVFVELNRQRFGGLNISRVVSTKERNSS